MKRQIINIDLFNEKVIPITKPCLILLKLIEQYNITAYQLAKITDIDNSYLCKILKSKLPISKSVSEKLSKAFGTSSLFFYKLELLYQIKEIAKKVKELNIN